MSPADAVQPIRLLLVDDHALFREGLARLLEADPEFHLVAAVATPAAALEGLKREPVDVLLLDYDLGSESCSDLVAAVRANGFAGKIFLVTAGLPDREALQIIRAGVAGVFHKQYATEDLKRSIKEVFEGKVLIEEHYLRKLMQVASEDESRGVRLTDREKHILRFLIQGLANKEIAAELKVSESAVKASMQTLFSKTGVRTRSQLVRVTLERFQEEI